MPDLVRVVVALLTFCTLTVVIKKVDESSVPPIPSAEVNQEVFHIV